MKITNFASIDKVISKIDKEFAFDNTDWVDNVPDWCVAALDMIDGLIKEVDSFVWKQSDGNVVQLPDDYYSLKNILIHNTYPVKDYNYNATGLVLDWSAIGSDEVIIEYHKIVVVHNENFDVPLPVIFNKSVIIDALSWYCVYCHMKRGVLHPVYSLASASPYLNPLLMWNNTKDSARATIAYEFSKGLKLNGDTFYEYTFDPKPSKR